MTDPNKLVRQAAGNYLSADERFEVRGGANRWFLVDTAQTDELGQELVRGPYATLDQVREAIPEARRADLKPLPRPRWSKKSQGEKKPARKPKPTSWIDKLPEAEAKRVRGLIGALEREGIADADGLVRRDRGSATAEIAARLIEGRLDAIVAEVPAEGRDAVRVLIMQVVQVLNEDGRNPPGDLPGWVLVEVGPEPEPSNRPISLSD